MGRPTPRDFPPDLGEVDLGHEMVGRPLRPAPRARAIPQPRLAAEPALGIVPARTARPRATRKNKRWKRDGHPSTPPSSTSNAAPQMPLAGRVHALEVEE